MRIRLSLLLILTLASLPLLAQQEGCTSHFTGSDKTDFDKGVEAFNNKRYPQCITLMRKVSGRNREAADPYFYLAVASARAGEKPGVVKAYFKRLDKVCPDYDNALVYYYKGVLAYTYKDYEEAVIQLNRYFDMANSQNNPDYTAVYEEASGYLYWSEFLAEAYRNQVPFSPTLLTRVSSKADELLPCISPDGKELYFLRSVSAIKTQTFYARENDPKVLRLFLSEWKDTAYSYGKELPYPFNQREGEGCVTLSADSRLLYLSAMEGGNCDLYYSVRRHGVWGDLQKASHNINGDHTWESQPSLTPDGQYIYFASNRDGGYGGSDIWRCRRLPNGDWSRAENLGPAVNTAGNEKSPFIHADSKTLYFASDGWQGFGGFDLYFTDITDTYRQYPTNLGLPINGEEDEITLGVLPDGRHAYFSARNGDYPGVGGYDLYTFELYPAAQPEATAIVEGTLHNAQGQPLAGTVSVIRHNPEGDRYLVDEEGIFALALSTSSANTVIATVKGCLPRALYGTASELQRDFKAADFVMQPAVPFGRYPLRMPRHGKSILPLGPDATAILDAYADYLLEHPRMQMRIEAPSLDEAKAIHDYLLSRQLRGERFEYKANASLSAPMIVITQM